MSPSASKLSPSQANHAFDALFEQLDELADTLRVQSSDACLEGNFARVKKIGERHNELMDYRKKLEKLRTRWRLLAEAIQKPAEPILVPPGKLRVVFDDEVIEHDDSRDTFIAALSKIGLEQIALLDKRIGGTPLVTFRASEDSNNPITGGQWEIHTAIEDSLKRKALKDIGKKLNVPLMVDLA